MGIGVREEEEGKGRDGIRPQISQYTPDTPGLGLTNDGELPHTLRARRLSFQVTEA